MANMIARLGVLLGLDTAQFNQGLAQSENKIEQFTSKAKTRVAALVAAFAAMTTKAVIFADEVADIAQANDVAIDSVIKLQNALAGAGGKADDAGKIFSAFTNYVDKAAEGSLEAHKNFAKIGVTFRDLETLSTQQLFFKTIQGLADIEDPLTRSAKAMEILGKAAKGVDLQGMNDAIKEQNPITDSQAKSIKILADFYDKLTQAGRDFTLVFADFVSPAIDQLNRGLDNLKKFTDSSNGVIKFITDLKNSILEYRRANLEEEIAGFERYRARTKEGTPINDWLRRQIETRKQNLAELNAPLPSGINVGGGRSAGPGGVLVQPKLDATKIRDVKKPVDPEEEKRRREAEEEERRRARVYVDALRRSDAEFEARQQASIAYAKYVDQVVKGDEALKRAMDTEETLFALEQKRNQMKDYQYQFSRSFIQLLADQREAQQKLNEAELLPEDREAAQKRLNEIYQRRLDLLKQIRDVAVAADADVGVWQGFKDAASDFFKNMPKDMETGAMMFQSVMGNMNQALDNFVRTGKLNFKDFARSIILDLIAIQLKASAMKLLSTLFGFNIPGKAAGGTVSGGSAYVVGERGPELFVPRMSGTIIPNHALSNVGAGGGSVTNNYINAIDVKSFEQRLMGSNKAIWAATQYAQKGLAVTPGRG